MSAESYLETIHQPSDRVIVALDDMSLGQSARLFRTIKLYVGLAKASSMAQRNGWERTISFLDNLVPGTMADQKYHDTPETVRLHVKELTACGPQFVTVHASSTQAMLEQAVVGRNEAKESIRDPRLQARIDRIGGLLGVTVLTSLSEEDCQSIYGDSSRNKVLQFAKTAQASGLDGIVCSGEELPLIRSDSSLDDLLTVVPGITPDWAVKASDQRRVVTPSQAVRNGADYIVVGRAITQPPVGFTHEEAARRIVGEIAEA